MTWRREDGGEIILKDNLGNKQQGKNCKSTVCCLYFYNFLFLQLFAVTSFGGEHLKLIKLSRSEMGSYLCIASNGKFINAFIF